MVILITGASRGIGFAIAEAYAAGGHELILVSKTPANLKKAEASLKEKFPGLVTDIFAADLSKRSDIERLAVHVYQRYAAIDVLINNAGFFVPGSVHNEPEGSLTTMLDANVMSAYHLSRLMLPQMIERKQGYIVNICSIASLQAYANGGAYSISKFAMLGMGKNLREELKTHGIKVTNVLPGATYTDSWQSSGLPASRFMEAADVAKMIVTVTSLSAGACVEEIIMRPQLGDI